MYNFIPSWPNHSEPKQDAQWPQMDQHARIVVIDLSDLTDLATVDFARLLLLRRRLLVEGRDLRLIGLHGRAQSRYEICRLQNALPCAQAVTSRHVLAPGLTSRLHGAVIGG